MKIKNSVIAILLATPILFAQSGEEIFNKNCSSCHATVLGVSNDGGYDNDYITPAPYITDLVAKLKKETTSKEKFAQFIQEYIENPDKRKTIYGKGAIKKFGLMPPLKGVLNDEEKNKLIDYLYNYDAPKKENKKINKTKPEISNGEKLFNKYCAKCHTSVVGTEVVGCDNSDTKFVTDKAPYITYLLKKIKEETKTKDNFKKFIKDYISHPDRKKSLFGKRAIKKFGLMPSLKDVMSEEEIEELTDFLYNENNITNE